MTCNIYSVEMRRERGWERLGGVDEGGSSSSSLLWCLEMNATAFRQRFDVLNLTFSPP